ncbi:hypothetical protein [Phaffia rhodozyma]|uniref:Uncharacterized protein n=1 Tax=Phaffia rhodozyma TaxID=264483 RepID=A0A0F7SJF0_PHARH|nr:hypothetical protein [Phaffia rhodozyma]
MDRPREEEAWNDETKSMWRLVSLRHLQFLSSLRTDLTTPLSPPSFHSAIDYHAGGQGGQLGDFPLSELVAQSSGRAELRELQPSEFWKAAAAHGINTDNLVYRVSNMKLYVGTRDGETHWNLDEAMYKMGRNAEHHPLMDYIVIPEDPVSSGKLVTSMDEDASIVVSNILAEGHSKALRLDESTEDQSVGEEGEAETKAKL